MSSGFYSYAPPRPSFTELAQREIDRLNKEKDRVSELYIETLSEINSIRLSIEKAKTKIMDFSYESTVDSFDGLITLAATEYSGGFSVDELFFSDIDVDTGDISYIAIDFSEQISLSNAVNSTEYKKMVISSEITKSLMLFCVENEQEKKEIKAFTDLMNKMLDDSSVSYSFFSKLMYDRYQLLLKKFRKDKRISEEKWNLYCSLCAITNKRPRRISFDEIDLEIDELCTQAFYKKYSKAAKKALLETFEELGLSVSNEYELEEVPGFILDDKDNEDFQFFVGEQDQSFVIEMIETEGSKREQSNKKSLCLKRKQICDIMKKKGFIIDNSFENDDNSLSIDFISHTNQKETNIERIKRLRTIQGKRGRARVIGG